MGYVAQQAVLATVFEETPDHIDELRDLIRDECGARFADLLVGPVNSVINGDRTYVLAPDGSKEGWSDSDIGDQARRLFVEHFSGVFKYPEIVEVTYGTDVEIPTVLKMTEDEPS